MKKILFTAFASFLMFSCNRDDNNSSSTTDSVVGTWKLTTFIILDGKDKKTLYSETNSGCEASNRSEYKKDGTTSFTYYDYSTGTCALKTTKTGTYTYDSTNKKLTNVVDGVSTNINVYSLSALEMQVQTGETDYNNDGTQDIKLTIYTKQ
jgi:hypothetical protein